MLYARLVFLGVIACTIMALGVAMASAPEQPSDRERFDKLFADGNFKDAYEGYRRLALDPKTEPNRVGSRLDGRRFTACTAWAGSMKSTHSWKPSSPPTRRTGGCSRRPPRATCRRTSTAARSSPASSTAASGRTADGRLVRARSRPRHPAPAVRTRPCPLRPRSRRGGTLSSRPRPGLHGQPRPERLLAAPEPDATRCAARL